LQSQIEGILDKELQLSSAGFNKQKNIPREISSAGSEHLVYTEGVGGSNPSSPTKKNRFYNLETVFLCSAHTILSKIECIKSNPQLSFPADFKPFKLFLLFRFIFLILALCFVFRLTKYKNRNKEEQAFMFHLLT
jgi:hypothetical protein